MPLPDRMQLDVKGTLRLLPDEIAKAVEYRDQFVADGSEPNEDAAWASALVQVAQDMLGAAGFSVEEAE